MLKPTHVYSEHPKMGIRYLADYMAGSKRNERSIIQGSKYRPIARIIQHTEAQSTVGKFLRDGLPTEWLVQKATALKARLADDDFERVLFDSNADYLTRFASVSGVIDLPKIDVIVPGPVGRLAVNGVNITVTVHAKLRRTTKTNKIRVGAIMLRYAKGKPLKPEAALWQSAFLLGYLRSSADESGVEPDPALCITVDAHSGICYPAPGNAVTRYANMKAACSSIAEQWPNVKPPPGAIF